MTGAPGGDPVEGDVADGAVLTPDDRSQAHVIHDQIGEAHVGDVGTGIDLDAVVNAAAQGDVVEGQVVTVVAYVDVVRRGPRLRLRPVLHNMEVKVAKRAVV